jgi:DNA-binding CsgD family transcriptional regulator
MLAQRPANEGPRLPGLRELSGSLQRPLSGPPHDGPPVNPTGRRANAQESPPARDGAGPPRALADALDLFAESAAPYEAGLARLALARTLASLGRSDAADAEARAAREAFAKLGAARDVARIEARDRQASGVGELTPREREVLRLVAQGLSDAEIADRLILSQHTVHRHVANVRTKLRLPSRAAAVAYAARAGLLSLSPLPVSLAELF